MFYIKYVMQSIDSECPRRWLFYASDAHVMHMIENDQVCCFTY